MALHWNKRKPAKFLTPNMKSYSTGRIQPPSFTLVYAWNSQALWKFLLEITWENSDTRKAQRYGTERVCWTLMFYVFIIEWGIKLIWDKVPRGNLIHDKTCFSSLHYMEQSHKNHLKKSINYSKAQIFSNIVEKHVCQAYFFLLFRTKFVFPLQLKKDISTKCEKR